MSRSTKAIDKDIYEKAMNLLNSGKRTVDVATELGLKWSTVNCWKQRNGRVRKDLFAFDVTTLIKTQQDKENYSYNELGYCILELNKIYIPFVVGGNFRKDYINVQSLLVHELTHIYHFQKYNHKEPHHDNYESYFASLYENECMINEIKFRLGSQTLDEIFADNKNLKIVFDKNKGIV